MNFESLKSMAVGIAGVNERVDGTPNRETDWTDMAQAIGKCSPEQADLLRALYLQEKDSARRTVERLARKTCRIEHAGRLSRDIAFSALRAFAGMRPCEHCDGHGQVLMRAAMLLDAETGEWTESKMHWKPCAWCKGDGHTHVQPDAVREMLGVSPQAWEMLCAQPFSAAYEQLRVWHKEGYLVIRSVV